MKKKKKLRSVYRKNRRILDRKIKKKEKGKYGRR